MTSTPTELSLEDLIASREEEIDAEAGRRAGLPYYLDALAQDIRAARARVAAIRALAGAERTLREALPHFQHRVAYDHSPKAKALAVRAREAIARALEWIAGANDAAVEGVAHPSLAELRTWEPNAFIRVQRERLQRIVEPATIQAVLDAFPRWEAELKALLARPMEYQPGGAHTFDSAPEIETARGSRDAWEVA